MTILAFNILRIIGYYSVRTGSAPKTKRPVKRRRIRTVIDNLIRIAGHLTKHAGRVIMSLARSTRDMLQIVQELTDKGVGLISMKECVDTDTPAGQFMLTVFAAYCRDPDRLTRFPNDFVPAIHGMIEVDRYERPVTNDTDLE